jgi:hypothetical protein
MNIKLICPIMLGVVLVLSVTISVIIYYTTYPHIKKDNKTQPISSESSYLDKVYAETDTPEVHPDVLIKQFNWLWNSAPTSLLEQYPIAPNLSFEWPPKVGQRFRMTAFPYPDLGQSHWWLIKFFKGMASLLDNTADQVTFPGWLISQYDPLEPNYNPWAEMLLQNPNKQIYLEVTHSCYAPPNYAYPTCDDGGYWLYGTAGSGVFWATCGRGSDEDKSKDCSQSGYIVANNKLHAVILLLQYAHKHNPIFLQTFLEAAKVPYDPKKPFHPETYLIQRLKGSGGGTSLMKALKEVIDAADRHEQIPKITAWRSMRPSSARGTWFTWILTTCLLLLLFLAGLTTIILQLVRIVQEKNWTRLWIPLVTLVIVVAFSIVSVLVEWNIASEHMFRGFGYITLDMALDKTNLTLSDFVLSCAGVDKEYNLLAKGNYNPDTNGLAQTQVFDFDLSYLTSILGLDSLVMHTQPNKSGSWAVEILDVRNTPATIQTKSLDDLIFKLGLCGQPLDTAKAPQMPPLKKGPLVLTPNVYFGYQPSELCKCDEQEVQSRLKETGKLTKCVFCPGTLSEQLC